MDNKEQYKTEKKRVKAEAKAEKAKAKARAGGGGEPAPVEPAPAAQPPKSNKLAMLRAILALASLIVAIIALYFTIG